MAFSLQYRRAGWTFGSLLWRRIQDDRLTMVAGSLAYVTLLSLVPLVTVVFSLFAAFPMFNQISQQLKHFIFNNFVPAVGNVVQSYLDQFVASSSQMTAVGIVGLMVTALLLIASVDGALNRIWRTDRQRPLIYACAIYWMILTLGPMLIGASMAISTYLLSMHWLMVDGEIPLRDQVLRFFPLLLSCASFWLLYCVVPTQRVSGRYALCGAVVASLLFELGKKIFALYVTWFPTYQLIYGVLAVIPILFVWVYWSWCIVLLGAEITATLAESVGGQDKTTKITAK